jgi:hypothetical protein
MERSGSRYVTDSKTDKIIINTNKNPQTEFSLRIFYALKCILKNTFFLLIPLFFYQQDIHRTSFPCR